MAQKKLIVWGAAAIMKALLIKTVVVCVAALICGVVAGVLFSLWYYGFIPRPMLTDVYLSDTYAAMRLRFWAAFAVGAGFGGVWSYRMVKTMKFE